MDGTLRPDTFIEDARHSADVRSDIKGDIARIDKSPKRLGDDEVIDPKANDRAADHLIGVDEERLPPRETCDRLAVLRARSEPDTTRELRRPEEVFGLFEAVFRPTGLPPRRVRRPPRRQTPSVAEYRATTVYRCLRIAGIDERPFIDLDPRVPDEAVVDPVPSRTPESGSRPRGRARGGEQGFARGTGRLSLRHSRAAARTERSSSQGIARLVRRRGHELHEPLEA